MKKPGLKRGSDWISSQKSIVSTNEINQFSPNPTCWLAADGRVTNWLIGVLTLTSRLYQLGGGGSSETKEPKLKKKSFLCVLVI